MLVQQLAPSIRPAEIRLTLEPRRRFEAIDVNARIRDAGEALGHYRRAVYCSLHTTAGYLDQSLAVCLRHSEQRVAQFFSAFHAVFPHGAEYRHDQLELREELTAAQKAVEPRNADSHLTFIGAGLRNCVTYRVRPGVPVYFVDLDGTSDSARRQRSTAVLAYDRERIVARESATVPAGGQPVGTVNLGDPHVGVLEIAAGLLARSGVERARVDLVLDAGERHAGLTVNEYESLLMHHDLIDVLRDPLRFARRRAADLAGVPDVTAARARRVRRSRRVSFLASPGADGRLELMRGTYQSPILVQWQAPPQRCRRLEIVVVELH